MLAIFEVKNRRNPESPTGQISDTLEQIEFHENAEFSTEGINLDHESFGGDVDTYGIANKDANVDSLELPYTKEELDAMQDFILEFDLSSEDLIRR